MDARFARGQVDGPIGIAERKTNELRALLFGGLVAGVDELLRLVVVHGGELVGFRQQNDIGGLRLSSVRFRVVPALSARAGTQEWSQRPLPKTVRR